MQFSLAQIITETVSNYGKRFIHYFIIIYAFTAASELVRQIALENFIRLQFEPDKFSYFHPLIFIPTVVATLLVFLGFASLYFCFTGLSVSQSILNGIKNLHRYTLFVIIISGISLSAFLALPVIIADILQFFGYPISQIIQSPAEHLTAFPIILILGAPGLYLAVSFSTAPFTLLLEKEGVLGSAWTSFKRVSRHLLKITALLGISLIFCGIVYFLMRRGIFTLKLSLIPDMSVRKESMLRVFLYSIPWVLVSVFFDILIYRIYLFLKNEGVEQIGNSSEAHKESSL